MSNSPLLSLHIESVSSLRKECSGSKNGSFVYGNISVLCSWCVNNILPVLDSSRRSWQWFFLLVISLFVSFLSTCTPCLLGILSQSFWIFSFLLHCCLGQHVILGPYFLQGSICVAFCELFPSWLSLLSEHSHSFLFKPAWSQRVRKLRFFHFPFTCEALCN